MDRNLTLKLIECLLIYLALIRFFSFVAKAEETTWAQAAINSKRIEALQSTPFGIFAGEYNPIFQTPKPYNGVFVSNDHGSSFQPTGLQDKGVTGLSYAASTLFASTFNTTTTPAGVYKSFDAGKSWSHSNISLPGLSIAATEEYVLFGTASNGLYRSANYGLSWTQTIGNGFAPGIKLLSAQNNLALAASNNNKVFLSKDSGITWNETLILNGKNISAVVVFDKIFLAGTSNNNGVYISKDEGTSWTKIPIFETKSTGAMLYFNSTLYISCFSQSNNTYGLFESTDLANTWKDISNGLTDQNANIKALSGFYSMSPKVIASQTQVGLKLRDESKEVTDLPFLELPWNYQSFQKDALKIYSFFDHSYPLLGYSYFSEPVQESSTTSIFNNLKKPEPYLWYSSHNGIDFTLPYGTEVFAAADGRATYKYSKGGGNTIFIDHGNGFQTWYMHLQKARLITENTPVQVRRGNRIGLVGMTGNTTGPHLHFSVLKDTNINDKFDDFPDGLVDPYGWDSPTKDPWPDFFWMDSLGSHKGSISNYLWNESLNKKEQIFPAETSSVNVNNLTLTIPQNSLDKSSTLRITNIPFGRGGAGLEEEQTTRVIFPEATYNLIVYDILNNPITTFKNEVEFSVDYSDFNLNNLDENTLQIVNLADENTRKIFTAINRTQKTVSGLIDSPGVYGLMATKIDTIPAETDLITTGEQRDSVFLNEAIVTLSCNKNPCDMFYGFNGEDFEKYTEPILVTTDSETPEKILVYYKSIDSNGNIENIKNREILLQNTFSSSVSVINSGFEIN